MDIQSEPTRQAVRLRGRSYVAFVFAPAVPIVDWLSEIDETLSRSPGFFVGKPVVLDLSAVDLSRPAISHLLLSLEKRNIRVLGIEGVEAAVLASNMPPLLSGGGAASSTSACWAAISAGTTSILLILTHSGWPPRTCLPPSNAA